MIWACRGRGGDGSYERSFPPPSCLWSGTETPRGDSMRDLPLPEPCRISASLSSSLSRLSALPVCDSITPPHPDRPHCFSSPVTMLPLPPPPQGDVEWHSGPTQTIQDDGHLISNLTVLCPVNLMYSQGFGLCIFGGQASSLVKPYSNPLS